MMHVNEIKSEQDLINFEGAVLFAISCANNADPQPASGCGRAYVDLGKFRANSKAATFMKKHGIKITSRPYCSHKVIYVGYDNADGRALAQASAMAVGFRECGFNAMADADPD